MMCSRTEPYRINCMLSALPSPLLFVGILRADLSIDRNTEISIYKMIQYTFSGGNAYKANRNNTVFKCNKKAFKCFWDYQGLPDLRRQFYYL